MTKHKMLKAIRKILAARKPAPDCAPEADPTVMTKRDMKDFLKTN